MSSAAREREYERRMTCPRCGQYGDGCNCDAATLHPRDPGRGRSHGTDSEPHPLRRMGFVDERRISALDPAAMPTGQSCAGVGPIAFQTSTRTPRPGARNLRESEAIRRCESELGEGWTVNDAE